MRKSILNLFKLFLHSQNADLIELSWNLIEIGTLFLSSLGWIMPPFPLRFWTPSSIYNPHPRDIWVRLHIFLSFQPSQALEHSSIARSVASNPEFSALRCVLFFVFFVVFVVFRVPSCDLPSQQAKDLFSYYFIEFMH